MDAKRTHVSHRNGTVLPVAAIVRMARAGGIDAIVDTARGFGQLDMYIRKGCVHDVDPYIGEADGDDIRTRMHTCTVNFADNVALARRLLAGDARDLHAAGQVDRLAAVLKA